MYLTRERFLLKLPRLSRVVFGQEEMPDMTLADIEISEGYQDPALYEGLPQSVYEHFQPLFTFQLS